MQTITQLITDRNCRVKAVNRDRRHLRLSIEGVHPDMYVPFGLVPSSSNLFALVQEIDHFSELSTTRRV